MMNVVVVVSHVCCVVCHIQHNILIVHRALVLIKSYKVWKIFFYHESLVTTADKFPKNDFLAS